MGIALWYSEKELTEKSGHGFQVLKAWVLVTEASWQDDSAAESTGRGRLAAQKEGYWSMFFFSICPQPLPHNMFFKPKVI